MPTWIKEDFKPDDRSYVIIGKTGAPREFVDDNFDHFISYWVDLRDQGLAKGKKQSWQSTLQVWMKRAWRGKCGREWEENRHRRQKYYGEPKGDLFVSVLENAQRERKGDCAVATAAHRGKEPPLSGKLDQVAGGRELQGMDSPGPSRSQSSTGNPAIIPRNKPDEGPPMSSTDAFAELDKILGVK